MLRACSRWHEVAWNVVYGTPSGALDTPVQPSAAALILAGYAPTLGRGTILQPGAGSLSLAGAAPALGPTYATTFQTVENPLSEGGRWVNSGAPTNGFTKMRVASAGKCYGTNTGSSFDDSYDHMSGWDNYPNQWVQVVAGLAAGLPNDGNSREIEIHLRGNTDTTSGFKVYEIDIPYLDTNINLVRWDGTNGAFTVAAGGFVAPALPSDGDVWYAQISGNVITLKQNGVSCGTVNVSSDANIGGTVYANGNPGIGAFIRPGANNSDFYFKSFSAGFL